MNQQVALALGFVALAIAVGLAGCGGFTGADDVTTTAPTATDESPATAVETQTSTTENESVDLSGLNNSGNSTVPTPPPTPTDTDGDGVPDDADYAPRDPEVQERSDLNTATPTPTPTPEPTPDPDADMEVRPSYNVERVDDGEDVYHLEASITNPTDFAYRVSAYAEVDAPDRVQLGLGGREVLDPGESMTASWSYEGADAVEDHTIRTSADPVGDE